MTEFKTNIFLEDCPTMACADIPLSACNESCTMLRDGRCPLEDKVTTEEVAV